MKILSASCVLLASVALGHGPEGDRPGWGEGESLVRIPVDSWAVLEELEKSGANPWACRVGLGEQLFSLDADAAAAMVARGEAVMVEADLRSAVEATLGDPATRGGGFFDDYQTWPTIDARLDDIATDPRVSIVEIGQTLEGRMVRGVRITASGSGAEKPAVHINGGQHAREWISPATCMWLIDRLVNDYGSDAGITAALDGVDVIVVPVVNADGYVYSWTNERFWRKNRRPNGGGSFGVDPNRNWAEAWGGSGSSGWNGSQTYRGPAPFSEPCTANLRDFIFANPEIRAHIDVHNFAQLLLGAWAYTNDPAPFSDTLLPLGEAINTAIVQENGANYDFRTGSGGIGFAAGAMPDWTFGELGIMSWTLELRDTGQFGFLLPASQIVPTGEEATAGVIRLMRQIAECPADLNLDGVTDADDLAIVISRWGADRGLSDVDLSGTVDAGDLAGLLSNWGQPCGL
jgi:murein tripeptide amidase MpaA